MKNDNILIGHDKLKITDFGLSQDLNLNRQITSVGTKRFMAPEINYGYSIDLQADVSII